MGWRDPHRPIAASSDRISRIAPNRICDVADLAREGPDAVSPMHGIIDGYEMALRVPRDARPGVAPGSAFGPGAPFLRICSAAGPALVRTAADRLVDVLRRGAWPP